MEVGGWQPRPDDPNATWTNYTQCAPPNFISTILVPFHPLEANVSLEHWIPMVKTMSRVGYSVSLITLVVAFLIMASIKKLRCPRNMLHMHLFASFMMRAFMSLLKDKLFIEGVDMSSSAFLESPEGTILSPDQHGWECKLVIGLWEFFIMANYSWVLMEGLYLHNLIFLALFSDTSAITLYVIIGWGLPVLVIVPWVALRAALEDTYCWTTHDNPWLFLVIRVPIVATILINFVLFVNIVRVLLLKLQSSICEETRKYRYRRWAKSTLVLVPLFGVHYTLFLGMSYSMGTNYVVEIIWLFCDQFFASFQGSFVATLYCFMNGEVRAEMNKIWLHHRKEKDGRGQWWLSSADAGSSSRRTSRALLAFPRKSRDLGRAATVNPRPAGPQQPVRAMRRGGAGA
ncbi:parathyroid hormone/parathyroid hormone-related peptide receptor-like [Hetaerina americana]|uniref:parathyroid hormone/parathyroid hormone-related peptide receptor-like n=1 Tax=Hetaerina americana TaxID=62018 RepID=UPI003A7F37A1